jgi:hypothetical protein
VSKPPDKVQLIKRESAAGGGDAADSDDFYLETPLDPSEDAPEVQGVFFQDQTDPNDESVYITRNGDDMVFSDKAVATEYTLTDLLATASGSGITENQHKALRDIVHFIDGPGDGFASGAYREIVGQPFPTSVVWYESAAKTQKIIEKTITRPTLIAPTPITWEMYDSDGTTVLVTVEDEITYDGIYEVSRSRTITV